MGAGFIRARGILKDLSGRVPHAWMAAGLAMILMIPAWIIAYYHSFLSFQPYDDEGTLMDVLRTFLSGRPLYDGVPSIYGPAFYLYEWAAHRLAGSPVDTDSIRFVSVTFAVASNLLVFWLVYRGTRSIPMASAAFVIAFRALRFIGEEPGHPQELCMLLVLAMGVAACYAENVTRMMWWLGGLAGALAMTKINAGALMVVAVGLALMYAVPWRTARVAAIAGALGFVWLLMAPLTFMDWTRRYLFVEELSLIALAVMLWRSRFEVRIGWREIAVTGAAFIAAVAAIGAFALANGSTPRAMFEWMIVKPRTAIGPAWYYELHVEKRILALTVVGLAAALASQTRLVRPWMVATAKLAGAAVVAVFMMTQREAYVVMGAPPLLWLLPVADDKEARERLSTFSRGLLAAIGILLALYAYPVAGGTQLNLISTFLIGLTGVAAADGLRWFAPRLGPAGRWMRGVAYAGIGLVLLRFAVIMPLNAHDFYHENPALNVPGARRLHLAEAAGLRNLVKTAQRRCTLLITAPGMPSFNIWTGLPRPAPLAGGNWVTGVDDATQMKIVHEIEGDPKVCVIYNQDIIAMWTHDADVTGRPVIRFIHENFKPVAASRGNALMVRR